MAAAVAAAAAVDSGAGNEEKTPSAPAAGTPSPSKPPPSPHDEIKAVARKLTDRPLQNPDPGVWGVLTAISKNARQRPQGITIILSSDEHSLGRLVEDSRFQIGDISISANHCKIIRRALACGDDDECLESSVYAFLKDTSTNGTYHNWKKLRKRSPEVRLEHGDIISFVHAPHEENAYAFVYREVHSIDPRNDMNLKRKSEDFTTENKRTKGIGIGSAEGPVSLDDVRSLQRSNMELRKQLESHVVTIEELRSDIRASNIDHENNLKKLKETVSSSYANQVKEIQGVLDLKQQELSELSTALLVSQNSAKDLNERVTALMQSRSDADEIINCQKSRISELETQLDEERNQRREEREKAAVDLKFALQRVQTEAEEEIKRQAEVYSRQNREHEELIIKLQETEKENRILLDTLRSKLEDTRENLVASEKKVRHLESQVQEEKISSENGRKKANAAELEIKRLKQELEVEKVAREEAWTKVSALELEIAAAMHELSIEKQRFQGARERIILRETQLRAFYSTTEEISALFAKQQEQLKAMQKTLEDEENGENMTVGFDLNSCPDDHVNEATGDRIGKMNDPKEAPGSSNSGKAALLVVSSSDDDEDDDSVTEKHDCDIGSQEDNNTQDLECTSAGRSAKAFGSEINGIETAPIADENLLDTERVQETESPMADNGLDGRNSILPRRGTLDGETMQLDDETQVQNNTEELRGAENRNDCFSQSRFEDTEAGTIKTSDLLASEVPGSWANSTAPSVHGENDSPRSTGSGGGNCDNTVGASDGPADGSQTNAAVSGRARYSEEHCALTTMIGIVAPELKGQFQAGRSSDEKNESMSDAETEEGSHLNADGSGTEESEEDDASVNGDDDVMIDDSVG